MNVRTRLFLTLVILLSAPSAAWATGTPAGTQLTSQAQVTFTTGSENHAAVSNPVATLVAEVIDLTVTWQDAAPVRTNAGALEAMLVYRLTNTGNGSDHYTLAVDGLVVGDQFDPIPGSIHFDTDGNGLFDPAVDEAYVPGSNDPVLGADAAVGLFVLHEIPATPVPGELGDSRLDIRSNTGTGNPGTGYSGQGDQGQDAVIGASGGTGTATGSFEIVLPAAALSILKTAVVQDPFGGTQPVSGATITYSLAVSAQGTGSTDGVVISDAIPANTTYNPGSLEIDGSPLSDPADGDAGDVGDTASGTITVDLGDIVAGSPGQTISFTVTID